MKKLFLTFLIFCSCTIVPPEMQWEGVSSKHEPVLNILGILSKDSLMPSFIRVHRSLNLQESQDSLVRDTTNGEINIYYASRSVVRNAKVIVSSSGTDYHFEYRNIDGIDDGIISNGAYFYDGDNFSPSEGETYTLSVSTPTGLNATGQTTIPTYPKLNNDSLPDTFQVDKSFKIYFDPMENFAQLINVDNVLNYFWDEINYYPRETAFSGSCGLIQEEIIFPGDAFWEYRREFCVNDGELDSWTEDWLLIQIMSMDKNYYDYFIKNEDQNIDFSNLFIGQGGYGRNYGVEGGVGVFGSIAIDRSLIPIKP